MNLCFCFLRLISGDQTKMKIPDSVKSLIHKSLLNNPRMSTYEIAELFGVSQTVVCRVCRDNNCKRPRGPRKGWKQLLGVTRG